ncbi:hypothetical protein BDR26DRAFT_167491 [Obelidium mucronatum]|nr:hypothetical protein BDR26DRAFT_167491 [Obelidium mucronatum]
MIGIRVLLLAASLALASDAPLANTDETLATAATGKASPTPTPAPLWSAAAATSPASSPGAAHPAAPSARPNLVERATRKDVFGDFARFFPQQQVVFRQQPATPMQAALIKDSNPNAITLPFKGTPYICTFPQPQSHNTQRLTQEEWLDIEKTNNERAMKLMHGLNRDCLNFTSSWWTYSYCHEGKITQYSNFPEKYNLPKLEYLLGQYKEIPSTDAFYGETDVAAAAGAQLIDNDADGNKYLRVWYGDGDMCENGLKRVAEVQFSCCENDHIVAVQETTLCQYIIQIHTKRACHKVFQPTANKLGTSMITCQAIVEEPLVFTEDVSLEEKQSLTVKEIATNQCESPIACTSPDLFKKPLETSADYSATEHHAETRADLLKGSSSAGIHPAQTNIQQEAFDTLWLDIYDPILLEGEDMDRVVEAANFVLFGGEWKDVESEDPESAADPDIPNESVKSVNTDDKLDVSLKEDIQDSSKGEVVTKFEGLMQDQLQKIRIDLWRQLVEKQKAATESFSENEDKMLFDGVSELLSLDLWDAALNGIPEEALIALNER